MHFNESHAPNGPPMGPTGVNTTCVQSTVPAHKIKPLGILSRIPRIPWKQCHELLSGTAQHTRTGGQDDMS